MKTNFISATIISLVILSFIPALNLRVGIIEAIVLSVGITIIMAAGFCVDRME